MGPAWALLPLVGCDTFLRLAHMACPIARVTMAKVQKVYIWDILHSLIAGRSDARWCGHLLARVAAEAPSRPVGEGRRVAGAFPAARYGNTTPYWAKELRNARAGGVSRR